MKYLSLTFLFFTICLLYSCQEDVGSQAHFNLDTYVDLSVRDAQGQDLLDPSNQEAFLENEIKLYYLVNGEQEEVFDGNLDYPRHFFIYENEIDGAFVIRIFPNEAMENHLSTTFIQWNEEESDTLECEFVSGNNFLIATQLWWNDQLIWNNQDDAFPDVRSAEIIK